ncbi:mediator of RNA polymerase II transcription subunit 14-like [Patiria miniata]|uniref:Mediator of RNA polymerase II transcription subunit 14 n=1 Tax=Patiria miniata TaxID=46514 RepID=A0A913ZGS0_PATMI|nr:mediator of RNA polymerase II transcription subunit 14-like [Patiria miniata]XP_038050988.1 mediator of RNA polymerase II transcription subunit 14-like [Patiria miniata]
MAPILTPQAQAQAQMSLTPVLGQRAASPSGTNSISLGLLLEFLIQKTYHELMVLSELLPRKTDMERKIEIVKFARSTRQSFVRLLALVKWASSAAKVDKCAAISAFLDQQSLLFVDTADMLSHMARENLVHARLPNFSLPVAVDVLTTGQYRRMPTCIKEKIVPPDPISQSEKANVLQRLNQIIQHRLVTSKLPSQLADLSIVDGRVKFSVPQEFEATLTLMGDDPGIPWRLLNIEILVTDPDTGDGKALVHPMQINYIHQLLQSRLFGDENMLQDMYSCLHSFCQSLQLEVLHSQAQRLIRERWGEHVMIEKYMAGQCLTLAYWRSQTFNVDKPEEYSLSIGIDTNDTAKPLQINHNPPLSVEDANEVNRAIRCDRLSIERLLVETIIMRSKVKLQELQTILEKELTNTKTRIEGTPPLLCVPIVEPCSQSEYLTISVDMQTGAYQPYIAHADATLLEEMEHCLNCELIKLYQYITKLSYMLSMHHCKQSIQQLPCKCTDKLPLVAISAEHPLAKLSQNRLYVHLVKHKNYYVVVEFNSIKNQTNLQTSYYLFHTRQAAFFDQSAGEGVPAPSQSDWDSGEPFLAPLSLVPLDSKSCSHYPDTLEEAEESNRNKKRKLGTSLTSFKKQRLGTHCEYFQRELVHIIALCDRRIPFISLCEELMEQGIPFQGIQVEAEGIGMVVKLCSLPAIEGISEETNMSLANALLECSFRLQLRGNLLAWQVQLTFGNCPVRSTSPREQGSTRCLYLTYSSTSPVINHLLQDWKAIGMLYGPVQDLASVVNDPDLPLSAFVEVRSFTFQKLVLTYGRDKTSTVTIFWDSRESRFHLRLAVVGTACSSNSHLLVHHQLEHEFNTHCNLTRLMQNMCDSQQPLQAISKLPMAPALGGLSSHAQVPSHTFLVIPQSSIHIRVFFRKNFCLDILCKGKNTVTIRDGVYLPSKDSKGVEGLIPAWNLKAFLEMFVDESVTNMRRRSVNEDDNPPSPISMDTGDSFLMTQHHSVPSPMARLGGATSSGFVHPMTPPTAISTSNPATPASPHTSMLSQQYSMSPGASGYPLASPPSIPSNIVPSPSSTMLNTASPALAVGSPSNVHHHVPSPGSFVPTPSPNIQMHSPAPGPFISPQSLSENANSPYPSMGLAMPSPGQRNWPASPSVPGPSPINRYGVAHSPGMAASHSPGSSGLGQTTGSAPTQAPMPMRPARHLPSRSPVASIPTALSCEAITKLFTPAPTPGVPGGPSASLCCPMERFLGSIYCKRYLHRVLQIVDGIQEVPSNEPGTLHFRAESLQYWVSLNPSTMQTLHLVVKPNQDMTDRWNLDEIQVFERYFESKVVCPPYKLHAILAFLRALSAPTRILKDLVQLMRLELLPDRTLKWTIQWCLTVPPPDVFGFAAPGTAALAIKSKMLFFIQLTRIGINPPVGQDLQSIVIPIVHDMQANTTSYIDRAKPPNVPASIATVRNMLERSNSLYQNKVECTIFPVVRDLMANLVIPL